MEHTYREVFMIRKVRFVAQEDSQDCGVACLLSMMKRYGGNSSLEQLRRKTKTFKDGTTAYHLIETAKEMGFEANGYRGELSDFKMPFIAHVLKDGLYQHYVIVESIHKNRIVINDPGIGIKKYSVNQFLSEWSHIGLVLEPKTTIKKEKRQALFLYKLIDIWKQHPFRFLFIFILSVLYVILSILSTYYLKLLFDHYSQSHSSAQNVFVLFCFIMILKVCLEYMRNISQMKLSKWMDRNILFLAFEHMIKLPYDYYNKRYKGDMIERINQLSHIRELTSKFFSVVFVDVLILLFAGFLLIQLQILLFSLVLFVGFLYFFSSYQYHAKYLKQIKEITSRASLLSQVLMESLSGIETIKGLNLEENVIARVDNTYHQLLDSNYRLEHIYNKSLSYKNLMIGLGMVTILYVSTLLHLEFGTILLFYSISIYFLESLKNLFDLEPTLRMAMHSISKMNEMFSIEEEELNYGNVKLSGHIKVNHLTYSYDDIHEIIHDLSFEIKPKEKVLISGPSGSGKSTFMKLLMGYIKISDCQLFLDQKDINSYLLGDLRREICYVPQEELLFHDSLYQNIVLYREVSREKFDQICSITRVDEIIQKQGGNPNLVIEDGGSNLSGGERQRILLARALLKDSNIYLFDESMSKMDSVLERDITKSILDYLKDKTILYISHSNQTNDLFDNIIKLKGKENL